MIDYRSQGLCVDRVDNWPFEVGRGIVAQLAVFFEAPVPFQTDSDIFDRLMDYGICSFN